MFACLACGRSSGRGPAAAHALSAPLELRVPRTPGPLGGVPVPSLTVNGVGQGCVNQPATPPFPWTAPSFDRLDLGWESYQIDDARTIYLDDVVISRSPIGCPP